MDPGAHLNCTAMDEVATDPIILSIRAAAEARGWSAAKLSREAGLHASAAATCYSGQHSPTIRTLRAMCDALGLELAAHIPIDRQGTWRRDPRPLNVYIAGPYTPPDCPHCAAHAAETLRANIHRAAAAALAVMERGHFPFCPHTHSRVIDEMARTVARQLGHADWLRLDDRFLTRWADCMLVIAEDTACEGLGPPHTSTGVAHELGLARRHAQPVYRSVDDLPPSRLPTDPKEAHPC